MARWANEVGVVDSWLFREVLSWPRVGMSGGADGFSGTGLSPPLLCTLDPILDVSGEASRGAVPDAAAAAAATAVDDEDKLSGRVFLTGERENRDFSAAWADIGWPEVEVWNSVRPL
jgi:hypothetical protein